MAGTYRQARIADGAYHLVLLVVELLRLRWPIRDVVQQLCTYNNHRNRGMAKLCSSCGAWLRQRRQRISDLMDKASDEPQLWKFIGIKIFGGLGFDDGLFYSKYHKE